MVWTVSFSGDDLHVIRLRLGQVAPVAFQKVLEQCLKNAAEFLTQTYKSVGRVTSSMASQGINPSIRPRDSSRSDSDTTALSFDILRSRFRRVRERCVGPEQAIVNLAIRQRPIFALFIEHRGSLRETESLPQRYRNAVRRTIWIDRCQTVLAALCSFSLCCRVNNLLMRFFAGSILISVSWTNSLVLLIRCEFIITKNFKELRWVLGSTDRVDPNWNMVKFGDPGGHVSAMTGDDEAIGRDHDRFPDADLLDAFGQFVNSWVHSTDRLVDIIVFRRGLIESIGKTCTWSSSRLECVLSSKAGWRSSFRASLSFPDFSRSRIPSAKVGPKIISKILKGSKVEPLPTDDGTPVAGCGEPEFVGSLGCIFEVCDS